MSRRTSSSSRRVPFRLTLCTALLGAISAPGHGQQLASSVFNEQFLDIDGNQPHADLSLFAYGNRVLAGTYLVDVSLNERDAGQRKVRFDDKEGSNDAAACLTRSALEAWGVNMQAFPALAVAPGADAATTPEEADDRCVDLPAIIPESTVGYDAGKQRLTVSIPQAALKRSARGAVDPSKWDKGITAGMLDYQLNFARYGGDNYRNNPSPFAVPQNVFDSNPFADRGRTLQRNTLFVGLRAGFNYGEWRFRNFSTYNRGLDGKSRWQGVTTYAQRDLAAINGSLLIGDGNTPGNFFDSLPFRGVQLSSDDAMLPDSQQGYAPTIRGVAQTNARVTVRQNGYIVYSAFVAPGPFVIDDLYPTASSGDLEVTVTEADGRESRYLQAFSVVPTLLREGTWRYSATAGQYRDANGPGRFTVNRSGWLGPRISQRQPFFVQATLARGLGNEFSLYGGLLAANMYQSLLVGVGKNLRGFGAVSVDLSSARSSATHAPFDAMANVAINGSVNGISNGVNPGERTAATGQSLRFLYSKAFLDSGTNFRIAGYRYSTSGYRTFQEALQLQNMTPLEEFHSRRNEVRFEFSQQVGDQGSAFASMRQQSYWGTNAKDRFVQMGYSGSYRQFGYSVYYNYSTGANLRPTRQIMFTLNIPIGDTRAAAQYAVSRNGEGRVAQQATVYGFALDDSRLTYSMTAATGTGQAGSSGSANLNYLSPMGRVDLGHSQGRGYGQTTLGIAGGVLVHDGGVTASQPLGETMALVQAPGARGVGFESQTGVATDWSGSTVISNLSPYRINRIAMRTADLGDTVEVKNAAMEVIPTRGAVVRAKFETLVGFRLLMTLTNARGQALPLGSKIENEKGVEVGVVGPEGQAFVTGAAASGRLRLTWGRGAADGCTVPYSLPAETNPPPIRELKAQCIGETQ